MYIEASEKNEIGVKASYIMNIVLFGMQLLFWKWPFSTYYIKLKSLANQSTLYFNTSM